MVNAKRFALAAAAALVAGGLVVGAAAPAAAQGWHYGQGGGPQWGAWTQTPGLDHRHAQQERWQRQGAVTGRITRRESRAIDHAQAGLRRHEAYAKADGMVTPRERRALAEHARRVDGAIAREYRDDDTRRRYGYGYGRGW